MKISLADAIILICAVFGAMFLFSFLGTLVFYGLLGAGAYIVVKAISGGSNKNLNK